MTILTPQSSKKTVNKHDDLNMFILNNDMTFCIHLNMH